MSNWQREAEFDILNPRRLHHAQEEGNQEGLGSRQVFQERYKALQDLGSLEAHVANADEDYAWPEWEDVDHISRLAVDNHQGYRDPDLIMGAVGNTRMQQTYGQHADIFDTAANLIAKMQRQQGVVEGNKRTAGATGLAFLEQNGYETDSFTHGPLVEELVKAMYDVSSGDENIAALAQLLREHSIPEAHQSSWVREAGPMDWLHKKLITEPVDRQLAEREIVEQPERAPDPVIRQTDDPFLSPDQKPIIYPNVPRNGIPFFVTPQGEIIRGELDDNHAQLVQAMSPEQQEDIQNNYDSWSHGRLFPEGFLDYNKPIPPEMEQRLYDAFRDYVEPRQSSWRVEAVGLGIPATYTPEDPYDIKGKQPLINAMQVDWMSMPPEQQRQVIINALRATMLSPRMNLKSNAILYQNLMGVPAEEDNPDVFESAIREQKKKWDAGGQIGLGGEPEDVIPHNELAGGDKYMPGFWGNIRRLANLGPFAEDIRQAAVTDMTEYGGSGEYFRNKMLELQIPGVQAKVASFAWLALAPNTSELATVDVHMMRHLEQPQDSPKDTKHYLQLEDQLRQERDQTYGPDTPLSWYQWGVWDARRTPGFHQDHTPLRAHDPTPYNDIQWPPTARPPRPYVPPEVPENQMSLMGGWQIDPRLARYRRYSSD